MDKINILVIEDDPINMKLISTVLQFSDDYAVFEAKNADDGIEMARRYHPDIILMDIMLPGLDGIEATKRLKEDQHTQDIPVLFISALDEPENQARALQSGGVGYITKPFQSEEVLACVEKYLYTAL